MAPGNSMIGRRKKWRPAKSVAVCLALFLGGCSSLEFDDRLLVKVPDRRVIRETHADGWNFRHVVEAPQDKVNAGNWYVAYRDSDLVRHDPQWKVFLGRWGRARRLAPYLADASRDAFGVFPTLIEPNLVFANAAAGKAGPQQNHPLPQSRARRQGSDLFVNANRTLAWPSPADSDPAWHLRMEYSQLAEARREAHGGAGIRVGILDNGFSERQAGMPEHLDEDVYGDAMGWTQGTPHEGLVAPGDWGGSHGTGTIGILAGRRVRIFAKSASGSTTKGRPIFEGELGSAPRATVVPVRIAPWVFSVETASLACGIDYASRVKHCDVLSMSHGGSPSQVWVDAVNAAYERGTAVFAAEGDFFSLGFDPLPPTPIVVPSSPVYPAAFRRVVGVTGVRSDGGSYARNSLGRLFSHPSEFLTWVGRGSYGPDGWRQLLHSEAEADPAERRLGKLRAYPIAAYSPNIPWLVAPDSPQAPANLVDLNGSGTSAATPQAAGAAALWLARHRSDPALQRDWHTWKKSEAVYFALLGSAGGHETGPDEYLGAGTLKATEALKLSYADVKNMRDKRLLNFQKSGRDYFDGSRSFWTLLNGQAGLPPRFNQRAALKQGDTIAPDREKAFARLYYNMLLLEAWHNGRLPRKGLEANLLTAQADKLAEKASATH